VTRAGKVKVISELWGAGTRRSRGRGCGGGERGWSVRAPDATAKKERLVWLLRRVGEEKCTIVSFFLEREKFPFQKKGERCWAGPLMKARYCITQPQGPRRSTHSRHLKRIDRYISGRSKTKQRRHTQLPFPLPAVAAASAGTRLCRFRAPSIRAGNPNP
jgi:hypothetical protein